MFYWLKMFVLERWFHSFQKENKTSVNFQSTNSWSWVIGMCLHTRTPYTYMNVRVRTRTYRHTSKMNRATSNQQTPNTQMNISTTFCCFIVRFFLLIYFTFGCRWSTKDVRCYCIGRFAFLFSFLHNLWLKIFK